MSQKKAKLEEVGTLESLRLINFMCHDNLVVEFGPGINFIVGSNGSGKSAVLTGLMVCLGAKANQTQRGNTITRLIKEGSNHAKISITFNNVSNDVRTGYRSDEYGDKIVIERRINREGTSPYHTRGQHGLVSRKREEVLSICDHFKIQVDNPINMLTQDIAKTYLASSTPESRYAFFLSGTYLEQLNSEYNVIGDRIGVMDRSLQGFHHMAKGIHEDIETCQVQLKEFSKYRNVHLDAENLKREIVWAQVQEKEEELEITRAESLVLTKEMEKLENDQIRLEQNLNACVDRSRELEEQNQRINNVLVGEIGENLKVIEAKLTGIRGDLDRIRVDKMLIAESIAKNTESLKRLDQKIEAPSVDLESGEIETQIKEARLRLESTESTLVRAYVCENEVLEKRSVVDGSISSLNTKMVRLKSLVDNQSSVYGENVFGFLKHLKETNSQRFLGPVGMYVGLPDKKWGIAVEAVLGKFLNNFVVKSYQDRDELVKLFRQFRCKNPIILYNHKGERALESEYLTVYKACTFEHPVIRDLVVSLTRCDRILLCESRREATTILGKTRGNRHLSAFTMDGARITVGQTVDTHFTYGRPKRSILFGSSQTQLEEIIQELETKKTERIELDAQMNLAVKEREHIQALIDEVKETLTNLQIQGRAQALKIEQSKRVSDQDQISNVQKRLEMLSGQICQLEEKQIELEQEVGRLDNEKNRDIERLEQYFQSVRENKRCGELEVETRYTLERELAKIFSQIELVQNRIQKNGETIRRLEDEYQHTGTKAAEYCDRVIPGKSLADLCRELELTEQRLARSEFDLGNMDKVLDTLAQKEQQYRELSIKISSLSRLILKLAETLDKRKTRWFEFRRVISMYSNMNFVSLMSTIGFSSELVYDHDQKKLFMSIRVDAQSNDKLDGTDIRSLSGGEKSLTTTCYLLSLWESMEASVRCLDEFDVFMDDVVRQRVLNMLLMYASNPSSQNTQYIFISPLSLSDQLEGLNRVRIIRMGDPQRPH